MSSIRFFIFSIIQFLIIYSLEATLNPNLDITKRCTNQPKLVSKSIPTKKLSKWLEEDNRKQFELIHKLWRKTNIFLEVKASTTPKPLKSTNRKIYKTKPSATRHLHTKRTSTPSFFEFYYRDEFDPKSIRNKKKNIYEDRNRTNKNKKRFQDTTKAKFLKYPDDTSNYKHALLSTTSEMKDHVSKLKFFDTFDNFFLQRRPELTAKLQKLPTDTKANRTPRYVFDSFFDRSDLRLKRNTTNDENSSRNETNSTLVFMPTQMRNISKIIDLSTLYDKINFFEMYDDGTKNSDDTLEEIESNKKDFIGNLTDFVNKTIFKTDDYEEVSVKTGSIIVSETFNNLKYINEPMEKYKDYKNDKITRDLKDIISWEDYPFVAVYIYKPLKVKY